MLYYYDPRFGFTEIILITEVLRLSELAKLTVIIPCRYWCQGS
jgi:hypothetical protein